jgi:hypothetical protein
MTSQDQEIGITGGCQCGDIRYEIDVPPEVVAYCHCRKCQKAYGNLFGIFAIFPQDALRFTKGEPSYYRTSERMKRGFCATCGTPLVSLNETGQVGVQVGTLDSPELFPATCHSGVESQISWLSMEDGLPKYTTESDPFYDDK